MKSNEETPHRAYQNVMELLVQEEIERQLKRYPKNQQLHINQVEIATFALNRLPPLYASSQRGKQQQKRQGQVKYKEQIVTAVRRGIAAIERDPLKVSQPIVSENEEKYKAAEAALKNLQNLLEKRNLLNGQELSWDNLASAVQQAFNKVAWTERRQDSLIQSQFSTPEELSYEKRYDYSRTIQRQHW